jgi:hypothetical protein
MSSRGRITAHRGDWRERFSRITRGAWQPENGGVPVVEFHTRGGPLTFTARDQTDFVKAFYGSATSAPSAPRAHGRIDLSVERLPDGEVSPYLMQDLAAGDRVELRRLIGAWSYGATTRSSPSSSAPADPASCRRWRWSGLVRRRATRRRFVCCIPCAIRRACGTATNCRRSRVTTASESLRSTRVQRLPTGRDRRAGSMPQSLRTPDGLPAFRRRWGNGPERSRTERFGPSGDRPQHDRTTRALNAEVRVR